MKLHEYNEMMRHLTRREPSDKHLASSNPLNIPAHMQHQMEGGQLTPEEFYQHQSIPQSERPLTGAEGGRVYDTRKYLQGGRVQYKPGGLVEPGVMHYADDHTKIEKGIYQRANLSKLSKEAVIYEFTIGANTNQREHKHASTQTTTDDPLKFIYFAMFALLLPRYFLLTLQLSLARHLREQVYKHELLFLYL